MTSRNEETSLLVNVTLIHFSLNKWPEYWMSPTVRDSETVHNVSQKVFIMTMQLHNVPQCNYTILMLLGLGVLCIQFGFTCALKNLQLSKWHLFALNIRIRFEHFCLVLLRLFSKVRKKASSNKEFGVVIYIIVLVKCELSRACLDLKNINFLSESKIQC